MSHCHFKALMLGCCFLLSTTVSAADAGVWDAGATAAVQFDSGSGEGGGDNTDDNDPVDSGNVNLDANADGGVSADPVAIDATVTILTPAAGETLEGPWIEVSFQIQGCQINGPAQDPSGCHLHKVLDGASYQDPEGGGTGHYDPTPLQMHVATAGSHELKLVLVRNDGTDLPFEPEISDSVTINVDIEATASDEEEEDGEETPYAAPVREKSEGCSCASSKSESTRTVVFAFFLIGFLARHRRRL
jgi:hypothetical protein